MHAQKFVYTVSGVALTATQKVRINEEIAAAVARVLLDASPAALNSDYLAEHPICGGSHKRDDLPRPGKTPAPSTKSEDDDGRSCSIQENGADGGDAA